MIHPEIATTVFAEKACKWLFQALVCLALILLTGPLRAQPESADPVLQEKALFWSVSRDGEAKGYLLGTIHSEDPRVLDFTEPFTDRLTENRFFAMEIVPDLPTMSRLTEYMQYQDDTTLEGIVGPERFEMLRSMLAEYKIPPDWMTKMKVWAAMLTLSVPPPETGLFMDFSLSLRAAGAGLKVVGLETLEQQLSFLEQMPLAQQTALLDQAIAEQHQAADVHAEMVDGYLKGDAAVLQAQAEKHLAELEPDLRAYFIEQGIDARNRRMVATLLPLLEQDRVFTAVGALHLPGESGLIQLLRNEGYVLEPLPLPLNAAAPGSGQAGLR